jgi:hypothetical protein
LLTKYENNSRKVVIQAKTGIQTFLPFFPFPLGGFVSQVILRSETTKNLAPFQDNEILRYAQDDNDVTTFDTTPRWGRGGEGGEASNLFSKSNHHEACRQTGRYAYSSF